MPAAISNLMQERERRMEEGEDEEERGYDSCDEGSTAASSIINPPSSLLDDYRRERSRFKFWFTSAVSNEGYFKLYSEWKIEENPLIYLS